MPEGSAAKRDLVLVGGGHAHVAVLRRFGIAPLPDVRLTLVSGTAHAPYSGMLPGFLAGHYAFNDCHIALRPLAHFAGARFLEAAAGGIDLTRRQVHVADHPPVHFDLLSINIGSTPAAAAIPGADSETIPVKPVDRFLAKWRGVEAGIWANPAPHRIAVIGGGAGGVELCLALQYRIRQMLAPQDAGGRDVKFAIVSDEGQPLSRHAAPVRRRMARILAENAVVFYGDSPVTAVTNGMIHCAGGQRISANTIILATHAAAPAWLAQTGLALDDRGFIQVRETLQTVSDTAIFAAGDVAAMPGEAVPKSGVFAVRQGPLLAENIRRRARGKPLRIYGPQKRALALISAGGRYAVASYGRMALEGAWVWRLKDWIDRRWIRRYQDIPTTDTRP